MCGIAGLYVRDGQPVDRRLVTAMAERLAHRGPDGSGIHYEPGVALAHRRLSIIDVAGGQQPIANEDETVWVTFNGEIYNFRELRAELESKGHRFRTTSDTEVIVHLYEQYGLDFCSRLRGMFAIGLWDRKRQTLVLVRDRVGKKPLYVYDDGRRLAFASELKALTCVPWVPREVEPAALDAFLTFGYVPAPLTIYKGVTKLLPGQFMVVREDSSRVETYWQLRFDPGEPWAAAEALDRFEGLLDESVADRLMSEVPIGAFLSGGIDSSLVVASMQRNMREPARTIAIGFRDTDADEAAHASTVASHLGTRHRRVDVSPDPALLPQVTAHFDEPFADPSALPTYWLAEAARESVTVALSGDGGDEAFGGYSPRYPAHLLEHRARRVLGPAARLAAAVGAVWPRSGRLPRWLRAGTVLENLGRPAPEAYFHDMARLRPERRSELLGLAHDDPAGDWSRQWFLGLFEEAARAGAADPLSRLMYVDTRSFLSEGVLVKVDRMSMAHGLEVRSPLLDHRMYEFAARLPARLKVRGFEGKRLLRQAVDRVLPEHIARRPKQGFDPPRREWLLGALRPLVEAAIDDGDSGLDGLVDRDRVRSIWKHFQAGGPDESPLLWTLLCLDLWQRSARQDRPRFEVLAGGLQERDNVAAGGAR